MVTPELLAFIKQQLQQGISSVEIINTLVAKGWKVEIIHETINSLTSPPTPQSPPKKRHILRNIFLTIGILVVLLFIFNFSLPYILNFFAKDAVSVQDQDLQIDPQPLPQNQNAFYDVLQIKPLLFYSQDVIDGVKNPSKWNENLVQDALSKNAQVFTLIDTVLQKPKYQNPIFADPANVTLSAWTDSAQKIDPFILIKTARTIELHAQQLQRQEKDNEAITESLKSVALGQLINGYQPTLVEYLVGIALKQSGLEASQRLLIGQKLTSDYLISQISNLEKYKNNSEGLVNSIKGEYLFATVAIDSALKGNDAAVASLIGNSDKENSGKPISIKNNYLFQPNKTKSIFAQYYRKSLSDIQQSCSMIKEIKSSQPQKIKPSPLMIFTQNSIGLVLSGAVTNSIDMGKQLEKRCNDILLVSVTQAMFALKAYKIDTGNYPQSLNELVPKYLPTIPEDPYGGKSIQYNTGKKILYSVGVGGTDQGGSEGEDWTKMTNPTFRIPF